MAGRIRREDIDLLRERADMAAVVSDHTRLKRAGSRMKGLCPFHDEKTPSFTIDPSQNLYYCFGCQAGGDVYDFLMKVEGLSFTEAVEHLARRTGYTLHYEELSAGQRRALGKRSRLVALMEEATGWYRDRLRSEEGEVARDYLKDRGFGRSEADRFDLGFAPNDWERLTRHLVSEGHDRSLIVEAGLSQERRGGRLTDRFRGRLIFPVRDVGGDVIGLGGRILPGIDYGDYDPPKYYNSPETPIYKKTRVLYGLHLARPEIVRADQVLVCEGYTDVMALHQAGYTQTVATCGTAVGVEHFRLLARYASRIVLAFDADEAGVGAARKAWEAAREADDQRQGGTTKDRLDLRVLELPEGLDPADMVERDGLEAVAHAVDEATPVLPFLLRREIAATGDVDDQERVRLLRRALALLDTEPDPDLRRVYAKAEIARPLGLSVEYVQQTAQRQGVQLDSHAGVDAGQVSTSSHGSIAQLDRRRARLERAVLRAVLQAPQHLPEEWFELDVEAFRHPTAREVFTTIDEAGGVGVELSAILEQAPDEKQRNLVRALAVEEPEGPVTAEAVRDLVRRLLADHLVVRADALSEEVARLNPETEPERWHDLNAQLGAVRRRRKELTAVRD